MKCTCSLYIWTITTTTTTTNNLAILFQATITANMKIKFFFDRAHGEINNILYEKKNSYTVGYTASSFLIQVRPHLSLKVNFLKGPY